MTAVRVALVAAGLWLGWHGIALLFDLSRPDLVSVLLWFAAAILVHDGIFAPLCALTGATARYYLPRTRWGPIACGAVCTVAVLLITAPVLRRGGAVADNPTVLDRDYPLGLTVALAVIWILVLAAETAGHLRARRLRHSGGNATGSAT